MSVKQIKDTSFYEVTCDFCGDSVVVYAKDEREASLVAEDEEEEEDCLTEEEGEWRKWELDGNDNMCYNCSKRLH